jgi:hypothetical protein
MPPLDLAGRFGIYPAAAALEGLTPLKPTPGFLARDSTASAPCERHLRFPHF